ncbi:MAG TPA: cysteine desulfurase-like protein [Pyrinomonadaceae bacterium]|jgi:cysteine desulfurase family protein (TIGR01976 family)|nr:cysteine desulfurase-like protein [Pyrinomonadaceae bacterium]
MTEATHQAMMKPAPTSEIRAHFPALERLHNGFPVAYFDGPGGTQVPRPVVEAMTNYLYHHNANTHWDYPTSAETDALIERARQTLADFLNATPSEIVFGANMTTLAFHLSRTLARRFQPGDEIIVTELDHHANVAPWHALALERGLTVRSVKMLPETGQLDWDDFARQLNEKTRLVAVGAASNALGTITDVRRAALMAHDAGALIFVDAVHYAPHVLTDVRALDCDFLGCSAYKFYGPHIGVLYGKRDLLSSLDFPRLLPAPDTAPERAETGTQNHEGMMGAAAAINFLASLAGLDNRREGLRATFDGLHACGARLVQQLWEGLAAIDGVVLYGPPPSMPRTPTVSFTVRDVSSTLVARKLATRGVFASHGDFYAMTVIERLGLSEEGLVRAGCSCYTTEEEVSRLIEGVQAIAHGA